MGDLSEHFDRSEFRCKGESCDLATGYNCGLDSVDSMLLDVLETIRDHFGTAVTISSAYRCHVHNAAVGGAPKSQHTYGRAADINVLGISPDRVADFAETLDGVGGVGRYPTFTHIDTRTTIKMARW